MKIFIILGTRPEIIKMSPVIRECIKKRLNFSILHTNQHYSENLDKVFFKELNLPQPKYNLNVGSGTHAEQTAKILIGVEKILLKEKPDIVLVEGDTNTVLAGALAAAKLHIKIGHIEAGLRSYFREMPEEINRILVDHCSDLLFTPTKETKDILLNEGILHNKIFVTGNTIIDAVFQNIKLAEKKSKILEKLNLSKRGYFLMTAHRAENVDNKGKLRGILKGAEIISKRFRLPVIYPIHPRARKMIKTFKLKVSYRVRLLEPLGYLDFLKLENSAKLILTDSGGIQEEACAMQVPCVTLRDNTERPETIKVGCNLLSGTDPSKILKCVSKMLNKNRKWKNPFGTGTAAKKIIKIIRRNEKV
ncbi:MAG TPA: UDP-N-acetylglucosamine 2-epimerase (non-hydrolyzing) [Candidatus Paceibacterota bacterium]|nr:UDP-N-acetylglucosamine 2-epimerase (non-hydrolyzing) [Candidatus Paceibacterota bacterium]